MCLLFMPALRKYLHCHVWSVSYNSECSIYSSFVFTTLVYSGSDNKDPVSVWDAPFLMTLRMFNKPNISFLQKKNAM